ncbi:MAG: hypothetical protein ABIP93_03845, partial [Gemmatimonadaceae bacterium]
MTTAAERVRGTRRALGAGAIARAVMWGVATTCALLAAIVALSLAMPDLAQDRMVPRAVAVLVGALVSGSLLWRARHVGSLHRVALWIEERIPELQYALVTAVEHGGTSRAPHLESHVARYDIAPVTRGALRRALTPAFAAAAIAMALLWASSSAASGENSLLAAIRGTRRGGATARGSRLAALVVRVTPPSYTGARPTTLDDPSAVRALVGSRVSVSGPGDAIGLEATLGRTVLRATPNNRGWSV